MSKCGDERLRRMGRSGVYLHGGSRRRRGHDPVADRRRAEGSAVGSGTMRLLMLLALLSLGALGAAPASAGDPLGPQALAQIVPGHSTKAELRALLGAPWRIVQFDDCGQAMAGQADETWEYRGTSPD